MIIKEITSAHHNDFYAIYQCEYCGHEHKSYGYNDDNFYDRVIPAMKCPNCMLATVDSGMEEK